MKTTSVFEEKVEKMIRISKDKPLLPEKFVPWQDVINEDTKCLPDFMVSLEGHSLWDSLTRNQQLELGRLEIVQVMYSYAWSETLACLFFNRHLLTLNPESVEYRFLIRELIEEFRHQEMFGMAIQKLERQPVLPSRLHKFFASITVAYFPAPAVFMSVLAVEMMADIYAKHIRKDESVYSVLRKCSELHHIEEGRHIFYTEMWLEKFIHKAGFLKRTFFSLIILANIYFMRTLYVKKEFFEKIHVENPEYYYAEAKKHYKKKFSSFALKEAIQFVSDFNGFNFITKPLWKIFAGISSHS
jgi:hypothetical protein